MLLRVLHLSDIHFSTKPDDELIVHTDVRDQLLHDLRDEIVPRSGKIDTVLIAGDIAFSGKAQEYKKAAEWLEKVASIADVGVLMCSRYLATMMSIAIGFCRQRR